MESPTALASKYYYELLQYLVLLLHEQFHLLTRRFGPSTGNQATAFVNSTHRTIKAKNSAVRSMSLCTPDPIIQIKQEMQNPPLPIKGDTIRNDAIGHNVENMRRISMALWAHSLCNRRAAMMTPKQPE